MYKLTVIAIVFFSTGAFLGFFVTNFSPATPHDWWISALIRVVWQLGGALAVTASAFREAMWVDKKNVTKLGAGMIAVGLLLCYNPLLDLIQGPEVLHGHLEVEFERSHTDDAKRKACAQSEFVEVTILRHLDRVLSVTCDPPATQR
jgi:hypothetical protein